MLSNPSPFINRWVVMTSACAVVYLLMSAVGCQTKNNVISPGTSFAPPNVPLPASEFSDLRRAVHPVASPQPNRPPPRTDEFHSLQRQSLTLDEAVRIALQNSSIISNAGGHVLGGPDAVRTPFDQTLLATHPNIGSQAALAAFDWQIQTSAFWNGGGRTVSGGSGPFGVYSQPTTAGNLGLGRIFSGGTEVQLGAVGGYDSALATGVYAAFGGELRHPLLKKSGKEFNQIAGPFGDLGDYRGVWIARINEEKSGLELEHAVRDLVRDVALTYWELYFAYKNLDTKRQALNHARQTWQREQERSKQATTRRDLEALARQQFHLAEATVHNAVSGTASGTGVYEIETKLRSLLGLPAAGSALLWPKDQPLEAEFRFDWSEALTFAQSRRVELRIQNAEIQRRELELRAARNLQQPQIDLVGQYRRLADDPRNDTSLFSEALHGWRVGVEYRRPIGNRREAAAVRNAELQLRRNHAVLTEQQRQISNQLRLAFAELDRAYRVTQSMAASRDAARVHLQSEANRHQAGDTPLERVLEAQDRANQAETSYLRSLVDYNAAFVKIHFARGTLLETLGVGFSERMPADAILFSQNKPSVFTAAHQNDRPGTRQR